MLKKISKQTFLLLIILIIASFFRLYNLSGTNSVPPGLYPDEAINGNNASEALGATPPADGLKMFYPENNGREGLFINIQALFIKTFGNEPWALRLPSAIFGILTVLGIYFLGSILFNNVSIGLLSSFFTAISFWHINFSRIGLRAIMAPLLLVWALYFLILAIKKNDTLNKPLHTDNTSWILSAFAGLIYGCGFYTYIAYRATPLLILVMFLLYWHKNKRAADVLEVFKIFILFAFIAILPLSAYFIQNPQDFLGRTTQISIFASDSPLKDLGSNILKTAGMLNFSGDTNWRHNFSGKPELYWPVGITFIFGILYGLKQIIKKGGRDFLVLFSWIIIAAIPVIISNEGMPHALRSILMIPPVFMLAGAGAVKIYELLINRIPDFYHKHDELVKNSFILLCALFIVQTYNYYFLEWGRNPNVEYAFRQNYVDMGEMLNSLPKETMKYVVVENSDVYPVRSRPAEGSATSTLGHSASNGVKVRGIPMPAQTVMFVTDTFTIKKQAQKNIHYLLPGQENERFENDALFFYLK